MIIPLTLLVVFVILAVLLRALLAPLLLVLSVILSFAAALGAGVFVSDVVFGFPGVDPSLPLIFLTEIGFIVAFGVLLDTFVVRSVIVPALVMDVGRRVWWPSRLARQRIAR